MVKELRLKVAEAIQDDVNKGIVRIDNNFMLQIGIRPGDYVEIKGERTTVALADRAYPGDIGLNIIRMDGIVRRNAKTGIGETVTITRAEIKPAEKIIIAPAQKKITIKASPNIFKRGLLGKGLQKGDIVTLGGLTRRKNIMDSNAFIDDFFSADLTAFGFPDIKFIVIDTKPKQAVYVTDATEIEFNPEAKEIAEEKMLEVTYEDIGGLSEEIKKIREMVELPLKHPEIFERLGIEPPKGVLLHGPPGTGKTLLAKAVANETASNFLVINGPEIMSKFYGQSEANVRKKFEDAQKNAPSIIFIDEIDAIAPKREESYGEVERRVVAQLLALMDGLESRGKVVVIAATNIPDSLDPALRRPGRFDREIEIDVPNKESRLKILGIHTRNMPIDTDPKSIDKTFNNEAIKSSLANILGKIETKNITEIADTVLAQLENVDAKNRRMIFDKLEIDLIKYLRTIAKSETIPRGKAIFIDNCLIKVSSELRDSYMRISNNSEISKKTDEFLKQLNKDLDGLIHKTVKEMILTELADVTYGFVGADLASLTKESAMEVLRRILSELKLQEDEPISKDILEKLRITLRDFKEALKVVRPSAMREVLVEVPSVHWSDVGGLKDVKQELLEAIEWPLKNPQSFRRLGVKPPKGVLLYGAPGTGKTLLAKAIATESNANFIPVNGPELLSKWVGESEKAVRKIFKKARQTSPSIIFFDEIDSIAPKRGSSSDASVSERVVNQILTEMDGLEDLNDVVVIAATNRPDIIDSALLRPGRFDRIVHAKAPDTKARELIFKIHTKNMPLKGVDLKELAKKTEGYVGADIESICREAAILTLRENIAAKEVPMESFQAAMDKVRPSITKEIEQTYENIQNFFSSAKGREMQEERPNYMG